MLRKQHLVFISSKLGEDYLSHDEKQTLLKYGINPYHLYDKNSDIIAQQFHLGIISDAIGDLDSKKLSFDSLKKYFEEGEHIPLTKQQIATLDSVKRQFLGDIRANEGRIFQDVNNIIAQGEKKNRLAYEKVIRDEITAGILKKKTSREIAQELGRKTGDWSRNFVRIVETVSHNAFDEGRAAMIQDKFGDDALVYKSVYPGACPHCVRLYLTKGIGSGPKIFKLSTLKNNGNNVGRKVAEYKPVIGSTHPYCFDEQTEVLTNRGWLYFKDLDKTEQFLSVNLQNGDAEWLPAINWVNEQYQGTMYRWSNKNFDLMTTPNHYHVIRTQKCKRLRLVKTVDLPTESHFLKHIPNWQGKVPIYEFDNQIFDPTLFHKFLGFFFSEGSTIDYKGRLTIHISQSAEKYLEEIYQVCSSLFTSTSKCKDYVQIMANKRPELWNWLRGFGKSNQKRIPIQVKESPQFLIEEFLQTYCMGDGSFVPGRIWDGYQCKDSRLYYTSSKLMADDLGELILKLKKVPSYAFKEVQTIYDPKRNRSYTQNQGIWVVRECAGQYAHLGRLTKESIEYSGRIYDVELERNNTLVVRRNGKVAVSGNCRCTIHSLPNLYDWNTKTQSFDIPKKNWKELVPQTGRKKIRVKINGREYSV